MINNNLGGTNLIFENNENYSEILVETCPTALIVIRETHVLFVNPACLEMLGYDKNSDIRDVSLFDHIAPQCRDEIMDKLIRRARGEDIPMKYETWGLKRDGSTFPVEVDVKVLDLPEGKTTFAYITDISLHKQIESALENSEKKYKELVNEAFSLIIRWDVNGKVTFFNEYAQQLLGLQSSQIVDRKIDNIEEANTCSLPPGLKQLMRKVGANPINAEYTEQKHKNYQAEDIWISWRNKPVFDESGELLEVLSVGIDCTERRKAEEKIYQSQGELKAILDSLQDTYYRVDLQGLVDRVSPSVEQLLGYSQEETIGIRLADLYVDPDGRNKFLKKLQERKGQLTNYQAQIRRKDNSVIWVSTNAHYCYDKQGNVIGIEGTTRDITASKNMEVELRQSTARFKSIFNAISDAVVFANTERKISLINPAVTRIFGYSFDELKGYTTEKLYASKQDYLQQGKKRFRVKADTGQQLYEVPYQRKDGSVFTGETFGTKIQDESGNVIGFIGIIRDISERKRFNERLRLSQKIFEDAGKAILVTDADQKIIEMNDAFCEITGYRRQELVGKYPQNLYSSRHDEEFQQNLWDKLKHSGFWQGELWQHKKEGEEYPNWASFSVVKNEHGKANNYVAVFSDISAIKKTEERLEQLAHYDQLTGIPNRMLFQDRLHSAVARAKRHKDSIAVMYVDLDGFKQVNDTLGHVAGDSLLKKIANKLKNCVRDEDTVARLGGDEFAIIINELQGTSYLRRLANRVVEECFSALSFEGRELHVSGSVGIATYPMDGNNETDLLRNADQAMYHAKQKGKNTYQLFDSKMNEQMMSRIHLESDLRYAITHGQLFIQYQPKYDLKKGKVVGVEALTRWQHSERGLVQPLDFIPIAEDSELIILLGKQVLNIACQNARCWYDNGHHNLPVSVNISARQFKRDFFIREVRTALVESGLPANLLEIEITESLLMDDIENTINILQELKTMGVNISIDDFGTGYSSLNYLKKLPVDTLKIDKSFVMDIANDDDDRAIISAIISMATSLNLRVIAEGVENEEQLAFLNSRNCHEIQGYLLAKPLNFEDLYATIEAIEEKHLLEQV